MDLLIHLLGFFALWYFIGAVVAFFSTFLVSTFLHRQYGFNLLNRIYLSRLSWVVVISALAALAAASLTKIKERLFKIKNKKDRKDRS